MSATTFSIAPFETNSAEGSRKSSFANPPTIILPTPSPTSTEPPSPSPPQPPDPSLLQPPSPQPRSLSVSPPPPSHKTSTSPRRHPPLSPPSKSRSRSPRHSSPKASRKPLTLTDPPPDFLTSPHSPVYQTHTSLPHSPVSPLHRKKPVDPTEAATLREARRQRFYRFLHQYHIHAEDGDLRQHQVIFPPGLLTGEGDMEMLLMEFSSLQSTYTSLLSILSSLPHLCLELMSDGRLSAYSQDPTGFLGTSLQHLQDVPYQRWFLEGSGRGSVNSRNGNFISTITLAYQTRQTMREEHIMFMGGKGKAIPITLTVIPVLFGSSSGTSFAPLPFPSTPPRTPTPPTSLPSDDSLLLTHAFAASDEAQVHAARDKLRREERAAAHAAKLEEIAKVIVVIENKELAYRLTQHTKRLRETQKAFRRSHDDEGERRNTVLQPKLDTGISSALTLMSALARHEKNASKKKMYAEIIHMLAHSRGMESVNEDVISQIEVSEGVGKDLKSWLINQINPTNRIEDRPDKDHPDNANKDGDEKEESMRISPLHSPLPLSAKPSISLNTPSSSILPPSPSPFLSSLESDLPRGMTVHNGDAQFIDSSPEISLIKKSRMSSVSGPGSHQGSMIFSPARRKTLKERKSVAEKKSLTMRASQSHLTVEGKLQDVTASLTQHERGPTFAPKRENMTLPLQVMPSDKRVVIERAADSRVVIKNWSMNDEGSHERSSVVEEKREGENEVVQEGEVMIKESVFTQVGCLSPEIHHNAALDCNTQQLFWTPISALRPKTVDPSQRPPPSLLHSPIYLTPIAEAALAQSLSQLSVWNQFNIFHVSHHSQGWPLTFTFTTILTQLNLIGKWGLDATLITNFIREVERGYFAVPYHSSTHAADVLQHTCHMITQTHLGMSLSDLDMLVLVVAAAVHDYGHPGVSNQYLTTTYSPLALQYNDKNVLESYHIASVFLLMQAKPECNIFQGMDTTTYRKARKMLIDLVLATDLASHFDILAVWKRKESIIDMSKDDDKMLVMQMILKSGDLGHPSRVRHLHLTWSELITEEFFQQGDREKKNGLNVSAMMDRNHCNIVTSQIGFISFLVMPIYSAFAPFVGTEMYVMLVRANMAMWERLNLESEELKRLKEEEEMELRRLAYEREELEMKKRKDEEERRKEEEKRFQEWESDMRGLAEDERRAQMEERVDLERAEQVMKDEMAEEEKKRKEESASVIVDVRLRRENDEAVMNEMTSSEEDEEGAEKEDEEERQRRRAEKVRRGEEEREGERQKKKREKMEERERQAEEKKQKEEEEKREAEEEKEKELQRQQQEWENDPQRIEREIEERMRRQTEILLAKKPKRSKAEIEEEEEEEEKKTIQRVPSPMEEREEEVEGEREREEEEREGKEEVELPEPASQSEADDQPATDEVEEESGLSPCPPPIPVDEEDQPSSDLPAPTESSPSPTSSSRGSFASRLALSIQKDRERVEGEREKERQRVQKERQRLLSAEERKAEEEARLLEQRVKRLLRREQAKARQKAREEEVEGLLEIEERRRASEGGGVGGKSGRQKPDDSARQRIKSVALREVSMLMMDKEWGIRRDKAEEKRIMMNYLQYYEEEHEGEEEDKEEDERLRMKRKSRASIHKAQKEKASDQRKSRSSIMKEGSTEVEWKRRASHKPSTEEWEDETEMKMERMEDARPEEEKERNRDSHPSEEQAIADESDYEMDSTASLSEERWTDSEDEDEEPIWKEEQVEEMEDDRDLHNLSNADTPLLTSIPPTIEEEKEEMSSHASSRRASQTRRRTLSRGETRVSRNEPKPLSNSTDNSIHTSGKKERKQHVSFHEALEEEHASVSRQLKMQSMIRKSVEEKEEEKEMLQLIDDPSMTVDERQRQTDKRLSLTAQWRRATNSREGKRDELPPARLVSSPSLTSHEERPAFPSSTPFTSFPPLTLPSLVPSASPLASRPLVPVHQPLGVEQARGVDWRAADDEEAMAAILRRVIPRSRQAELERARRAIMTKAKMK